jgi:hypothetical protein
MFRRPARRRPAAYPDGAISKMSYFAITGKAALLRRALNRRSQVKPGLAHRPGLYPGSQVNHGFTSR